MYAPLTAVAVFVAHVVAQSTTFSAATLAQTTATVSTSIRSTTTSSASNAQTSITILLGSSTAITPGGQARVTTGFAASVISANPCATTLALVCTNANLCGVSGFTDFVTWGPSIWNVQANYQTQGASFGVTQRCVLYGPQYSASYALCTVTVAVSSAGTSKTTSIVTSNPGAVLNYEQIPITAGAQALSSATGSCTAPQTGAAAPAATGIREVYKVIVPVGAVLLALA